MDLIRNFLHVLTKKELRVFLYACAAIAVAIVLRSGIGIQEHSSFVPVKGGELREGMVGQPIFVNPVFSENQVDQDISALVFSPLKDISTYINADEENKVFTVSLREDLKWDDGTPVTSDDVIFTIKTAQDPEARSPIAKNWSGAAVERMSVLQVRIAIPESNVFFADSIGKLRVIPKHVYGNIPIQNMRLSSYTLEPIGNGPYSFDSFAQKKNGFITKYALKRNESYHGESPYIDRFSFFFYENEEGAENAFRLREIDAFGTASVIDTEPLESARSRAISVPTTRYYALFFNVASELFSSAATRRALTESVSKENIAAEVLFGKEEWLIENPSFERGGDELHNPERSRETIANADENIIVNVVVPDVPHLRKAAETIRSAWNFVGVEGRMTYAEPREVIENFIKTGNYDAILFGNTLENTQDLFPFWHSSQRIYPGLNISLYRNQEVDSLIETARKESRKEKRDAVVQLINAYLTEDNPAIFLYSVPYTYMTRSDIGGIAETLGGEDVRMANPAERFSRAGEWFVAQARVLE